MSRRSQPFTQPNRRVAWAAVAGLLAGLLLVLALAWALLVPLASRRDRPALASPPLAVVATIPPLADIARELGGERVKVAALLPSGASPHTFEPRPSDIRNLATARLLLRIGAGLDDWVATMVKATSPGHLVQLDLSQRVSLLHSADPHTGRSAANPHYWLDPIRVRDQVAPAISAQLIALDPSGQAYYSLQLTRYQQELTRLDAQLQEESKPQRGLRFIAVHSAWDYLAARYGLQQVAAIEEFPGREPSAAWLAELESLAKQHNVHQVVAEAQFNPQVARLLARAVGGRVAMLDPLGGPGVAGRETYLDLMRYNVHQLLGGVQ